jgi:hypothetical protein
MVFISSLNKINIGPETSEDRIKKVLISFEATSMNVAVTFQNCTRDVTVSNYPLEHWLVASSSVAVRYVTLDKKVKLSPYLTN